jgi:cytochrome c oxidase cbb3-type subunit III
MSLRFPASLLLAVGAPSLALVACDREERQTRGKPIAQNVPAGNSPDTVYAGNANPPPLNPGFASYERNAPALAQGQQLYLQMNCVGCHFHGGGGMGPALMDDKWRYGGRIDQIAATIAEGRPNGMPAWRDKLTSDQIWQLAAYVRSMSGQVPKDAVSSRADEVSNTEPLTQTKRKTVRSADPAQQ